MKKKFPYSFDIGYFVLKNHYETQNSNPKMSAVTGSKKQTSFKDHFSFKQRLDLESPLFTKYNSDYKNPINSSHIVHEH